ncbi:LysR substrate binding domain protein [compost metagenome]
MALAIIADSDALGIFVRNLFDHQLLPRALRMIPLAHELPAARVAILTRADSPPTPAAQCFIDCLLDAQAASQVPRPRQARG